MSNVRTFTSKEKLQEQASLWISRIDRGLSPAEQRAFVEWTKQSDFHKSIVFDMAALWDDMSVLNKLSQLFPRETKQKLRFDSTTLIALAASVVFAMVLGATLMWSGMAIDTGAEDVATINTYKTNVGEHANYQLPDGSIVHLNTASEISFDFTDDKRVIYLNKGEAQFDVVSDKSRPFTVISGEKSFTALGTVFNVEKENSADMQLIVTEGKVLITNALHQVSNIAQLLSELPEDNLPGIVVRGGEKAVIENSNTLNVAELSSLDEQKALAWQSGTLIFDGDSIADVISEIGRYSDTHFSILDHEITNYKVSGYFKTDDIDSIIASLENNFSIKVTRPHPHQVNLQLK